jgi:hypothetical protein
VTDNVRRYRIPVYASAQSRGNVEVEFTPDLLRDLGVPVNATENEIAVFALIYATNLVDDDGLTIDWEAHEVNPETIRAGSIAWCVASALVERVWIEEVRGNRKRYLLTDGPHAGSWFAVPETDHVQPGETVKVRYVSDDQFAYRIK